MKGVKNSLKLKNYLNTIYSKNHIHVFDNEHALGIKDVLCRVFEDCLGKLSL
jgi:hypothetical protein